VKLKNEPGALAQVAEAMATRGVDIRAFGGGGIGDTGIAAFVTDNDMATREALMASNCEFSESEAVVADVDDKPGTLARLTRAMADAGVNLQGAVVMQWMDERARLAFAVDDPMKAREALRSAGAMGM
jgi:hypothetical protein